MLDLHKILLEYNAEFLKTGPGFETRFRNQVKEGAGHGLQVPNLASGIGGRSELESNVESGIGNRSELKSNVESGIGNRSELESNWESGIGGRSELESKVESNRESLWKEWELLVMMWNHHCKVHTRVVVNTTKRPNTIFFSRQNNTIFLSSPRSEKSFASDQQLIQCSKFFQKQKKI